MKIKEAAAYCGLPPSTLRYYEAIGLLSLPRRTKGNYRDFGLEAIERLRLIRSMRDLDFSLEEIQQILEHPDPEVLRLFVRRRRQEEEARIQDGMERRSRLVLIEETLLASPTPDLSPSTE